MGTMYKILVVTLLMVGLIFARIGKNNDIRSEEKKVKSEHYWVKDQSDSDDKKLDRKRSHKRRRRIRKPVKGLR